MHQCNYYFFIVFRSFSNTVNSNLNVRYNSETDTIQCYYNSTWYDVISAGLQIHELIPIMESDNAPKGKVTGSASPYGGTSRYMAFTGTEKSFAMAQGSYGTVVYTFDKPVNITKVQYAVGISNIAGSVGSRVRYKDISGNYQTLLDQQTTKPTEDYTKVPILINDIDIEATEIEFYISTGGLSTAVVYLGNCQCWGTEL